MRVLSGIKPTGQPHLGNYLGMIRPALRLAEQHESFLFIADLHAMTTIRNGGALREQVYEVAATWLALGLDPQRTAFFRQSDVPEIPRLSWVLACYTPQGLLERAHAVKAARDAQAEMNAGLYTYPVLMAADILAFGATHVPVGLDQKQHLEIARDIAARFNHHHPGTLRLPEPLISQEVAVVPGLDGRKMSKSYGNTLALFDSPGRLRQQVFSIVTDSAPLEASKEPESSLVYRLYALLADPARAEEMADRLRAGGYGWGHAKQALCDLLEETFGPTRERYERLLSRREELDRILADGADRARTAAAVTLGEVMRVSGLLPAERVG